MNIDNRKPILYSQWTHALRLSIAFSSNGQPGDICYVIGSGGCGKTVLSKHLHATLYGDPSTWRAGKLPVIRVEVDVADRGYFAAKSLMRSLLVAVRHPRFVLDSDVDALGVSSDTKRRLSAALNGSNVGRMTEPDMRFAFVEIGKLVELKLIIVDEANLLALTQHGRMPTDYLESLRRLADQIGCGLLLLGTLDMLAIMDYSAQLNRRSLYVHLDRMTCDDGDGKKEYVRFLGAIEKDFELSQGLLTSQAGSVYASTYGIPGEIVGLVRRAKMFQAAAGQPMIAWPHIVKAMHAGKKLRRMRTEADLIAAELAGEIIVEPEPKKKSRRRVARIKPRRRKVEPV